MMEENAMLLQGFEYVKGGKEKAYYQIGQAGTISANFYFMTKEDFEFPRLEHIKHVYHMDFFGSLKNALDFFVKKAVDELGITKFNIVTGYGEFYHVTITEVKSIMDEAKQELGKWATKKKGGDGSRHEH